MLVAVSHRCIVEPLPPTGILRADTWLNPSGQTCESKMRSVGATCDTWDGDYNGYGVYYHQAPPPPSSTPATPSLPAIPDWGGWGRNGWLG